MQYDRNKLCLTKFRDSEVYKTVFVEWVIDEKKEERREREVDRRKKKKKKKKRHIIKKKKKEEEEAVGIKYSMSRNDV